VIEFYPQVRWLHVGTVILSGALFVARGLMMLARSPRANHALLRYPSYAIDTLLLATALALAAMLRQYPFVHGWLTVKVLLLVVYIVLGSLALKRGRSYGVRAICFGAALAVYACIVAVARAHHPLGPLARWLGS
jgi:uncharacterized membrane protein SirB2